MIIAGTNDIPNIGEATDKLNKSVSKRVNEIVKTTNVLLQGIFPRFDNLTHNKTIKERNQRWMQQMNEFSRTTSKVSTWLQELIITLNEINPNIVILTEHKLM